MKLRHMNHTMLLGLYGMLAVIIRPSLCPAQAGRRGNASSQNRAIMVRAESQLEALRDEAAGDLRAVDRVLSFDKLPTRAPGLYSPLTVSATRRAKRQIEDLVTTTAQRYRGDMGALKAAYAAEAGSAAGNDASKLPPPRAIEARINGVEADVKNAVHAELADIIHPTTSIGNPDAP